MAKLICTLSVERQPYRLVHIEFEISFFAVVIKQGFGLKGGELSAHYVNNPLLFRSRGTLLHTIYKSTG